ncbi:MAG: M20 family metallopeptidase [Candidatus Heimdallarchaeota archaeon]
MTKQSGESLKFTINEPFLLKTLKEMISINSVLGNETNLAEFLLPELEKLGFKVELEDALDGRKNIYGKYVFDSPGKTLTFNGHSDTVAVCEGWTSDPFKPTTKNGKLIGLGSADMKGGLACQLAASKTLIESGEKISGTLHYSAVVDEEGYGTGARKMLKNPRFGIGKTDGVIISEPCYGDSENNPLPLGLTGKILYKITVVGKSAHAFRPDLGINAVNDASHILSALDNTTSNHPDYKHLFDLPQDDDFGTSSFCTLKIDGGYKLYSVVVPERCEIILNRLLLPGETKESAYNDLVAFILKLDLKSKVQVEIVPPFYFSYKIAKEDPLIQSIDKAYVDWMEVEPVYAYQGMITDANTFMGEGGIPTAHLGPKGGNLHALDEYVEINSLYEMVKLYTQAYVNFQKTSK